MSLYRAGLDSLGIPTERATAYADMREAVPQAVLDEIMGYPVVTTLSGYIFELLVPFGSIAPAFDPTLNDTMGFELFWRDKDGAEDLHWASQAQSTEVPVQHPGRPGCVALSRRQLERYRLFRPRVRGGSHPRRSHVR